MSDDVPANGAADEQEDLGTPVDLRGLGDEPTRSGFFARVRKKVERRQLTNQFVIVSWHLPKVVLIEFIKLAFGFFDSTPRRKGGEQ